MEERESRLGLSRDALRSMEIASLLPELREFAIPTTRTALARHAGPLGGRGWIDMKLDPATGDERPETDEHYRKDRVYGWIQGRTLESLVAHLDWAASIPGYLPFDAEALSSSAERLYRRLYSACMRPDGVRAFFVTDLDGEPLCAPAPDGATTLSHLFVLRGLVAYAAGRGRGDELMRIVAALRLAVDASIRGECLDDQVRFGDRGGESYTAERLGYEGQMISIGACELLYASTRDAADLKRGMAAISTTMARHARVDGSGGASMIDAFRPDGSPYLEGGRLLSNPGHAIEFVGLALQFIRKAGRETRSADLSGLIETLKAIALGYDAIGRAPHGGIVRAIDAETGAIAQSFCPWWSSFEAVRTFAELYGIAAADAERDFCLSRVRAYVDTIRNVYLRPSAVGIPVQTVSVDGEIVPIIPATPDIDAGYHSGMPLLDAYSILGPRASMLAGAAEIELPPLLGRRLQGHIARSAPAERQMDGLRVRSLIIADHRERLLLVSADALEFGEPWASRFASSLASELGLRDGAVILIATHTHTAPASMRLGVLDADAEFLGLIEAAARESALNASGRLQPAEAYFASARAPGLGINRRLFDPAVGTVAMKPNPKGEVDDEVGSLFLFGRDGEPFACVINFATHPTTLGVGISEISADYPGRVARSLRVRLGDGFVAIPAQGACGDVRPAVLDASGKDFAEGTEADVERIGGAVAGAVIESLSAVVSGASGGPSEGYEPRGGADMRGTDAFIAPESISVRRVEPRVSLRASDVELALSEPPGKPELERMIVDLKAEIEALRRGKPKEAGFAASHEDPLGIARAYLAWAEDLVANAYASDGSYVGRRSVSARFHRVELGDGLRLLALPGEAFCRIGLRLKERARPAAAFVLGYSGGTVGYIPTAAAYAEGGYEVSSAHRFYGLPSALSPEAERLVTAAFDEPGNLERRSDYHV